MNSENRLLCAALFGSLAVFLSLPVFAAPLLPSPSGIAPIGITANIGQMTPPHATNTIMLAQNERRSRNTRTRRSRKARRIPGDAAASSAGLAGRYAILRENNKDVGCVLSLRRGGRAQLGPGCSDQGFVVFDPIRWQGSGSGIVLRARKGHRIKFSRQPDGTYRRDPAAKKSLGLKKY